MSENNEQQWFQFSLPTTPLLKCTLTDDIITYLWKRIKVARDENIDVKHQLAGNIEQSLQLTDENDYFFNNVLKDVCRQYVEENPKVPSFSDLISFSTLFISAIIKLEYFSKTFPKSVSSIPFGNLLISFTDIISSNS